MSDAAKNLVSPIAPESIPAFDYRRLAIILPTLNEAGNIQRLIANLREHLPGAAIVVVDDSSKDQTAELAEAMSEPGQNLTVLRRPTPPCLTESIQAGIDLADVEYVAWMDADFSHPPSVLVHLFAEAESGAGCAIATRYLGRAGRRSAFAKMVRELRSSSFPALVLSMVLNVLIRRSLGIRVTDYTSGFIVCRRSLIESHKLVGDYGEYFIELMYYLTHRGVEIIEVSYESPPRTWGESKTGTTLGVLLRRGVKYIRLVARLIVSRPDYEAESAASHAKARQTPR